MNDTTQSPRDCHTLGVCMHPIRKCTGRCELSPDLPITFVGREPDQDPGKELMGFVSKVVVAGSIGIGLGLGYGIFRLIWAL